MRRTRARSASRFVGENLDHNLKLVEALREVAAARATSVAAIAVAWVLSRGPDIVPLVGARKRRQWSESSAAASLALSEADLAAIEAAVPKGAEKGERYAAAAMAGLDSERKGELIAALLAPERTQRRCAVGKAHAPPWTKRSGGELRRARGAAPLAISWNPQEKSMP